MSPEILKVRPNGTITIPAKWRKILGISGSSYIQAEMDETRKQIRLEKVRLISDDQAWFWTQEWQQMEKEADEDIKKGKIKTFKSIEDLIADLKK